MSEFSEIRTAVFNSILAACGPLGLSDQNICVYGDDSVKPNTAYLTFRVVEYGAPAFGPGSVCVEYQSNGDERVTSREYRAVVDIRGYFPGCREYMEALKGATIEAPPASTQMGDMLYVDRELERVRDISLLRDAAEEHRLTRTLRIGYIWSEAPEPILSGGLCAELVAGEPTDTTSTIEVDP